MWDLRFDGTTNRGLRVAYPGEPLRDGEFSVKRNKTLCAWFGSMPERYQFIDGVFSESPVWEQEQADALAAALAKRERLMAIEAAIESAGVHVLTVEQAENYINNQINNAETAAEKVEAVRNILLKMVPYLLK